MIIKRTDIFTKWFKKLDTYIQIQLLRHINKLADGKFTSSVPIGEGVHELRVFFQKGYRTYFANINGEIILLLCGGTKGGNQKQQQLDIARAKEIKRNLA
jgi:putative addiction module killer protein